MVNNKPSDSLPVSFQGSLLGLLLFSMNIKDMPNLTDLNLVLFADNPTRCVIDPLTDIVINKIQSELTKMNNYTGKNSFII